MAYPYSILICIIADDTPRYISSIKGVSSNFFYLIPDKLGDMALILRQGLKFIWPHNSHVSLKVIQTVVNNIERRLLLNRTNWLRCFLWHCHGLAKIYNFCDMFIQGKIYSDMAKEKICSYIFGYDDNHCFCKLQSSFTDIVMY